MKDLAHPSGTFAKAGTVADQIHCGYSARNNLEDYLDGWWEHIDRITTDYYDNSLEIYFEDHVVDLEPTPEQIQEIFDMGFFRFWLNFQGGKRKGGTERYYYS